MYPWGVLGIDETNDKKVIKKAYAKLIRQHRPENEPEKFQEINQAYQYALNSKTENQDWSHYHFDESAVEKNPVNFVAKSSEYTAVQKSIEINFKKEKAKVNLIQTWAFLPEGITQLSFEEKDVLAKKLFNQCFEVNNNHINQKGELFLSPKIMQYLNIQFSWGEQWNEYSMLFNKDCLDLNFQLIHDTKNELNLGREAGFTVRLKVFIVDLLIVLSIFTLSDYFMKWSDKGFMFSAVFFVYQLLLLITANKESTGYWFYKLKSVNYQYKPTQRSKKFERIFVFHCSILSLHYIIGGFKIDDSIRDEVMAGIWSLLVILCVVVIRKFPVDEFTDSKVLKYV